MAALAGVEYGWGLTTYQCAGHVVGTTEAQASQDAKGVDRVVACLLRGVWKEERSAQSMSRERRRRM